jgi:hypothetical protein
MKNTRARNYKNSSAFAAKGIAMFAVEAELVPFYQAVDIASGYLVRSGYGLRQANDAAYKHIVPLFSAGERRPLMLANRAIAAIEKERVEDEKLREACLAALYREHG